MEKAARSHLIRAVLALVVAVAGLILASSKPALIDQFTPLGAAGAALLLVGGVVAVRALSKWLRAGLEARGAGGKGAAIGLIASIAGYILLGLTALPTIGINLEGLLVGGALTGVALGIAAQQTLGNFFAGVVLLLVRPFVVGEHVILKSGALGGEYEGIVTDMGLFYVNMQTDRGPVALPNAGVLASAVGPGARSVDPTDADVQGPEDPT